MYIISEIKWEAISETEVCKKWWNFMADIMYINEDNSPVTVALKEVFNLSI